MEAGRSADQLVCASGGEAISLSASWRVVPVEARRHEGEQRLSAYQQAGV